MKFSENWLRSVCDTTLSTSALSDALTMAGLEVESVEPVAKGLDRIVVGCVTDVRPHPNADRLRICDVDVGLPETLQIVCGAPNVSKGMKVPTALVKARLPRGLVIKSSKLRGERSEGMLCSASELALAEDHAGLMEIDPEIPVGSDIREVFDLNDNVFTLKLTANRGDCLSIVGIARELQAITGVSIQHPVVNDNEVAQSGSIAINIDDDNACELYMGLSISGVNPGATTPGHILRKLERSGIRGISPIVDLTNYVMLELGQPMHAFDQDKLQGDVSVRMGKKGEELELLNGQVLDVSNDMLMICDDSGPIALAGIMGGQPTAVNDQTSNIFLEAAVFSTQSVAGKWRSLGFSTDALHRFERGVDSVGTKRALWRLANLITEICGGTVETLTDAGAIRTEKGAIRFRPDRVRRLIGMSVSEDRIKQIFERLEMTVVREADALIVKPPSYRFDLVLEEDLIEEVVRIEGFDKLPSTLPNSTLSMMPVAENSDWNNQFKKSLVEQGYQEVITYSFVDHSLEHDFGIPDRSIGLANPIAEQYSVMRTSLLGSLALVTRRNKSHRADRIKIFESSLCFERSNTGEIRQQRKLAGMVSGSALPEQWGTPSDRNVDFFDVKGELENILKLRGLCFESVAHRSFHPGKVADVSIDGTSVGIIGGLHPELSEKYDLDNDVLAFEVNLDLLPEFNVASYEPYAKFPAVRRDVAFEVALDTEVGGIINSVASEGINHVTEVNLFDVYSGKGVANSNKSVALAIILQSKEKTLTDEEVEKSVAQVLKLLTERFNATLRK